MTGGLATKGRGGRCAQGLVGAVHTGGTPHKGAQMVSGRPSLGRNAEPRPARRGVCGVCGGSEEGVGMRGHWEPGLLPVSVPPLGVWGEAGTEVFLPATPGTQQGCAAEG